MAMHVIAATGLNVTYSTGLVKELDAFLGGKDTLVTKVLHVP